MRILLTTPTYPPFNSGLGNAVAQQASLLFKEGHEVIVATSGEYRSTRDDSGIRVETFDIKGSDCWFQKIRGDVSGYVEFLIDTEWDVVVLNAWQNWATDIAFRCLERISGRKFLYSHCVSTNVFFVKQPIRSLIRYFAWRPYWWGLAKKMKRLDGLLFLANTGTDSRFDDLNLANKLNLPLKIIPNMLSEAGLKALTRPIKSLGERKILMAVGTYQWPKGFDFVLKAYAASAACNYIPIHFYGNVATSYLKVLKDLASDLGINGEFVFFHEGVSGEGLIAEYANAKLLLSGSHTECQPLVIIDSNATATPFVARATGCISQMPGGVAVRSSEQMADQIDLLAFDSLSWNVLSRAGHESAARYYTPDRVGKLFIHALNL